MCLDLEFSVGKGDVIVGEVRRYVEVWLERVFYVNRDDKKEK